MNRASDSSGTSPPVPNPEGPARTLERRQWVRFVLPDLVTRLSWRSEGQNVSHLVSLVRVNGESAAVILNFEPPREESFLIHFDSAGSGAVPVRARLVATEAIDYGRILASFEFDLSKTVSSLLPQGRDRRAWRREVPKERSAVLSWVAGDSSVSVDAELQNIGGGGAAVRVGDRPPTNEPLWLWVGREGSEAGPVECRMVGCASESEVAFVLRLAFVGLCPMPVFLAAMGLEDRPESR
ncbi:MAG: hypothetical protein U0790_19190 [Isosphaeraceae bacterium]